MNTACYPNRPLPSCLYPLFQSDVNCKVASHAEVLWARHAFLTLGERLRDEPKEGLRVIDYNFNFLIFFIVQIRPFRHLPHDIYIELNVVSFIIP